MDPDPQNAILCLIKIGITSKILASLCKKIGIKRIAPYLELGLWGYTPFEIGIMELHLI